MKKHTLPINGKRHEVSKEVYRAYYQHREHERYLRKRSEKYEIPYRDDSPSHKATLFQESVEDMVIEQLQIERMMYCFRLLNRRERQVIWHLYFQDRSEREVGQMLGLPKSAVNTIHKYTLNKLYLLMKYEHQ